MSNADFVAGVLILCFYFTGAMILLMGAVAGVLFVARGIYLFFHQ